MGRRPPRRRARQPSPARSMIARVFAPAVCRRVAWRASCRCPPAPPKTSNGADLTAPPTAAPRRRPSSLAGTLAKVRDSGTITLGYRDTALPFSYVSSRRRPRADRLFDRPLPRRRRRDRARIAGRAGARSPMRRSRRRTAIDAVRRGKVDLECGSTTDNLERRKLVAFSPRHLRRRHQADDEARLGHSHACAISTGKTLVVTAAPPTKSAMRRAQRQVQARHRHRRRRPITRPRSTCWPPARPTRSPPTTCCSTGYRQPQRRRDDGGGRRLSHLRALRPDVSARTIPKWPRRCGNAFAAMASDGQWVGDLSQMVPRRRRRPAKTSICRCRCSSPRRCARWASTSSDVVIWIGTPCASDSDLRRFRRMTASPATRNRTFLPRHMGPEFRRSANPTIASTRSRRLH